jgi:hypothetical protein
LEIIGGAAREIFLPSRNVSTQAWIFLVGLRIFDLGGMIAWLVWFFRRGGGTDEREDDGGGDGGGGTRPPEGPRPPGPGLDLPIADSSPWPTRLRDHGSSRRPVAAPRVAPARVAPPAWRRTTRRQPVRG